MLSNAGVAEPSTMGISDNFARMTATSRAEYRNPLCCLNDTSCSSSTIITPQFFNGAKTAERVPITIQGAFFSDCNHALYRFVSVKPECSNKMGTENRASNRATVCGVKEISGTSTNAC